MREEEEPQRYLKGDPYKQVRQVRPESPNIDRIRDIQMNIYKGLKL
jgi:hypothetical protein